MHWDQERPELKTTPLGINRSSIRGDHDDHPCWASDPFVATGECVEVVSIETFLRGRLLTKPNMDLAGMPRPQECDNNVLSVTNETAAGGKNTLFR